MISRHDRSYQDDEHNYFYAQLDGLNVLTNLNYGIDGARLRFESKVRRSANYDIWYRIFQGWTCSSV
ncbi:unnamed protein product [Linum trigynum]|uniref:Uncharacterized protein n=1 Tax=Linum trigynum TaxID=586398 RepID=A0AAV2CYK8_9ROSI